MRVPREQFQSLSLEVHGILSDVPLHDVTAVDLPGGGTGRTISDVRALLARENVRAANPIVRGLFALRALLGRLFGWDPDMHTHPETSSIHRLSSWSFHETRGSCRQTLRVIYPSYPFLR
jgi:Protein of unknown function (DUF2867)